MRLILRRATQARRRARMERDRILQEERLRRLEEQRRRNANVYPPAPPQ
jgi:hypothetical protein